MSDPNILSRVDELERPGDHQVDSEIVCVLTRFGLRSVRSLLPIYRDYRRVVEEAHRVETPGLLQSAFLIESARACWSLSIWSNAAAIPRFGTNVPAHVDAANAVFKRLEYERGRGPELWSTKWQLASVSNNLSWKAFELRTSLPDQTLDPTMESR